MASDGSDRRRFQRVALLKPLACRLDDRDAFLFNLSIHGALVGWEERQIQDPTGEQVTLRFEWHGQPVSVVSRIAHTRIETRETRTGTRRIRKAGVDFIRSLGESNAVIRSIIGEHVERALDEQRANARGIPPLAASSFQAGAHRRGYIRCQLRSGSWTRTPTTSAEQPKDGFTVSAEESDEQIGLLCGSYETASFENRQMIRKMAELSISQREGIPTRRYEP